jgi:hypothetical protein
MHVLLVNYLECPDDNTNPCDNNSCGPNSVCRSYDKQPVCSCQSGYIGLPPNCRPECTLNADCIGSKVCVDNHCTNPCPGSCAAQALCSVVNHVPICMCPEGYTGDPFKICSLSRKT